MNKSSIKGFTFTFYSIDGTNEPNEGDKLFTYEELVAEHDKNVDEEDDDKRMIYALTDEGWQLVARWAISKPVAEIMSSDLEARAFFEAYEADDEDTMDAVVAFQKGCLSVDCWDKIMLATACKAFNKSEVAKAIGMTPQRLNNCLDTSRCQELNLDEMYRLASYLDKVGGQLKIITNRLHYRNALKAYANEINPKA